ncbi:hypothetical protein F5Y16DRAFT_417853 [Xylariaceae sp. FL0255]|nr:hypothetical protein F5Y16DRAFT_417853 [Xylariaceae sp. FL0255]
MPDPQQQQERFSPTLPNPKVLITTHTTTTTPSNSSSSSSSTAGITATLHSVRPATWKSFDDGKLGFHQIYTNEFPAGLNDESDISFHERLTSPTPDPTTPDSKAHSDQEEKPRKLGLALKNGTVARMVDFSPGYVSMMHRTQSLDFGVVIEGEVDMLLDDGSTTRMKRGDVAVQRATMHAWRNPSTTDWARMMFVLQDAKPLVIDGERYREDLGDGTEDLASGNDD